MRTTSNKQVYLSLISEAYRRQSNGFTLGEFVLSPDQQFLAARNDNGTITVYQLLIPYSELAAFATQTAEPGRTFDPRVIGVQATPTQSFDQIGGAQPTLTPTITPTSPPPPSAIYTLPERGQISEFCPLTLHTTENPPESYQPSGRLLVTLAGEAAPFWVYPLTGEMRLDETIPRCEACQYSPNQRWMLRFEDGIAVSRPDGSDYRQLFTSAETGLIYGVVWYDEHTIEYRYDGYLPERSNATTLIRHYDVNTDSYGEPFEPDPSIRINDVYTEEISRQPRSGDVVVARQSFTGRAGIGYKYYIVDQARGETQYIARLVDVDNTSVSVVWLPDGSLMYYKVGDDINWYVYDPATGERYIFGELDAGLINRSWSRNEDYALSIMQIEFDALPDNDPFRFALQLYDLQTGSERRYCFDRDANFAAFSPDERYVAVRKLAPEDADLETARLRTYILDLQTGDLVEIIHPRALDIDSILIWTE